MSTAKEIRVRVPASSANLGPGFDSLALALGLHLRCTLRASSGGLKITSSGANAAEIPREETNLIWKTFLRLAGEQAGKDFELEIVNEIPLGRGLGSSAAAIVAGLALADAWLGVGAGQSGGKQRLIDIATGLEGHPDNVAAAALGGLVVSCQAEDGRVLTAQCTFPREIEVVLVVPELRLSTEAARAALPQQYSRRDAVFNVQRVALFLATLQGGGGDLLKEAMRDRLHQPYRAPLIPGFSEALKLENIPGLLGIALSGAGPSIVVFCQGDTGAAGKAVGDCFRRKGIAAEAMPLPIDTAGLVVENQ
ncbi:MAG: homoserine kinase [Acidobacteria bacterium]|nr:homoserine kinase [Acidobacteriota bacterium]